MAGPLEAKAKGIVFIHQELSLAEELSVAENIYLGELPRKSFGRVDWPRLAANANAILKKLNVGFDAKARVGDLSIANQQMVEIARALTVDAKAVIFDEPTASLTDAEKVVLFDVIADLQREGVGIIYISHRMEEIFKITDRITVLRDGQYQGTVETADTNEEAVTQMMIGRKLDLSRNAAHHELGDVALEVRGLSCGKLFHDVSFEVRRGEVLGFYGLVGAGRTEIAETLFGLRDPSAGQILLDGEDITTLSADQRFHKGLLRTFQIAHEFSQMSALENLMMVPPRQAGENLFNTWFKPSLVREQEAEVRRRALEVIDFVGLHHVRNELAGNLSGGQKKLLELGRTMMTDAKIVLLDEIAAGVNRTLLGDLMGNIERLNREMGYTFLVIEHDMDMISRLCDPVIVLAQGSVMVEGHIEAIQNDPAVIEAYFGSDAA